MRSPLPIPLKTAVAVKAALDRGVSFEQIQEAIRVNKKKIEASPDQDKAILDMIAGLSNE